MGTQFIGLLCLLFGMGAFFGLWLLSIKNRSKSIETDEPRTQPQELDGGPLTGRGYSLSPVEQPLVSSSSKAQRMAKSGDSSEQASTLAPAPVVAEKAHVMEEDDPMAKTHLEIATQFFNMGDFEGAAEMCQLVIDNKEASEHQKTSAKELIMDCA